jgi:hypothetical protein
MHAVLRAGDLRLAAGRIRFGEIDALRLLPVSQPNSMRTLLDELVQRVGVALDVRLEADSSVVIEDTARRCVLATVLPASASPAGRQRANRQAGGPPGVLRRRVLAAPGDCCRA